MAKNKPGVLATVTETFNIFNDGRKFNTAPQSYLLESVLNVARAGATQERIKLGEAVGFFGHTIRELTGKLKPSEMEVIMVKGKTVVTNVEPAIRCVAFACDEKGNVTHTEEFLDSDTGKLAYANYKRGVGGFSWAMRGNGQSIPSVAVEFAGFDYVDQPNFIPLNRQGLLLASMRDENAQDMLLASIQEETGMTIDEAKAAMDTFSRSSSDEMSVDDLVIGELVARNEQSENQSKQRSLLLASVIDNSPFLFTAEQKRAMLEMKDEKDAQIVTALFASMKEVDFAFLPHNIEVSKVPTARPDETPYLDNKPKRFE
ncbi:hypothetical protein NTE19_003383 [Vibrio fluvialis]|nr:hypothetical protein [Vibrio fluvialis]